MNPASYKNGNGDKEDGLHQPQQARSLPPRKGSVTGLCDDPSTHEKETQIPFGDGMTTTSTAQETYSTVSLNDELRALVSLLHKQNLPQKASCTSIAFANLSVRQPGLNIGTQQTLAAVVQKPIKAARDLLMRRPHPESLLLHGIDGVVREGEMLLVLGRPGFVSSALLKALSGQKQGELIVGGEIKYNGVDIEKFKRRFKGDAIYVPDVDFHFPYLLVGNTLDFASETKTPKAKVAGQSRAKLIGSMTDVYGSLLGVQHTFQTRVGNEYVQGISGGERKRVSLAEAFAMRSSVTMWDNPTHGLDSSASQEFINTIRAMTKAFRQTAVVALYQGGETLTKEFDKVTVLYQGHQIFFGTVPDAKHYFEHMGFECHPHQTTADFLTAISDPTARKPRAGWEPKVPRSPEDFVRLWKLSYQYSQLQREIQEYKKEFRQCNLELAKYETYRSANKSKHQRQRSIYTVDTMTQFAANLRRSFCRFVGDKAFLGATAFSSVFMSLIMGSLFYNVTDSTSGYFSKGGALFFAILFNSLQTIAEIGTLYSQRPIIQRQNTYAMYHPFLDSLASLVVEYPYKIVNVTIFDIILYFLVGLKREASAFFILWLTTYLSTLVMSAWFRTIAALTNSPEAAIGAAGFLVLAYAIYTGYTIPKPSMHPWFKWITYVNPLSFAFETLIANEFHDTTAPCDTLVPSGPGYSNASATNQVCAVTGSKPGQRFVNGDDYVEISFDYHYSHVWRNVGILCAFLCGFVVALTVATEFRTASSRHVRERLYYRKGHEPEQVKRLSRKRARLNEDEEGAQDFEEVMTEIVSHVSATKELVTCKKVLTWKNVTYDIILPDGSHRRLLDDITGYVKPGTLTALMGESGAGKTTLLKALAARLRGGILDGEFLVSGELPDRSFHRTTGYVQQQDVHLSSSTVREALQFSAKLRQPKEIPLYEKLEYVEKVIEMMEMEDFAEAIIGVPGSGGLNIEQRKRATIAVELVAKPEILLFLDEPTSGLDSLAAWSIVRLLRKLADSGQAILCTIHQPSSMIFEHFDRLLLLAKGGKPVYFGEIGQHSKTVLRYFEEKSGQYCPLGGNPAEFMLDIVGAAMNPQSSRDWNKTWMSSEEYRDMSQAMHDLHDQYVDGHGQQMNKHEHSNHKAGSSGTAFAESWTTQYLAVQLRLFVHYWRIPQYVMGKIMLNVVAGLFLGFTFYKEGNSPQGLQNKLFASFTSAILGMPIMNQFQPQFSSLAKLFTERENPSGMYHWSVFVLSNLLTEITFNILAGTLFFFPWYFAIDFSQGWVDGTAGKGGRGFYMWLLLMAYEMWISTFGVAIASLAPNSQTAAVLTTVFASFVVAFNGVLQPLSQLPQFWHFMYHASPYTYLMSGYISNVIHGTRIICASQEINVFQPPLGQTCMKYAGPFIQQEFGYLSNPDAISNCQYCRYSTGDQYLVTRNMDYGDRWRNFGLMCVYNTFNAGIAFPLFYLAKVATFDTRRLMLWRSRFRK
ncbi:uncharacterized protein Z519_10523 [Cladophialophora bantiana CBS 173.52]|uniref:ABC transporter domain-containing protein n=1 Tax=Cladophialophora bantiana (strain ATCC 10958 / CBS 173.52 / CDC B-1940 / NIH 8579) TaxID=1442370 RepID=A0A0D2H700_CLAB1|nr:uncharacterized protein Z519_10523 [Cladophialophora bantiana CBS 173.52]KIW89038.1 hypothetical protein Z519_10523 [Cladophialophora bantiana CBS 173.52]